MEQKTYRCVTEYDELRQLVDLQGTAWPVEMFTSAAQMRAAVLHGGSVIAVYDTDRPIGFCYGFAAYDGNEIYLNSHMMVVHPDYRDQGLGTGLKLKQRIWAMERGYSVITWTYDPLQLRNGFLNICKLGGVVSLYLPSVYSADSYGDPSDRFLVRWELESPRVCAAIKGEYTKERRWSGYDVLPGNVEQRNEFPPESARELTDDGYLLAVPLDAAGIKQRDPSAIILWKQRLRAYCEHAFGSGYRIVGLIPGDANTSCYVLERARGQ